MSEIVATQKIKVETQDHQFFLKELGFQEHFVSKFKAFDGKFEYVHNDSQFYLHCRCTAEMKNKIEKTMDEFFSSLVNVALDQNVHDLLSTDDSTSLSFLKKELKEMQICFLKSGKLRIYTVPENREKVDNVVKSSFIQKMVSSEQLEYFYFTTSAFQDFKREHEDKTLKIERKDHRISFTAIKPIGQKLLQALAKYENGSQPSLFTPTPLQQSAIKRWKSELREDVQNQNRAEVMKFLNSLHSEGKYIYTRKALLLKEKQAMEYVCKKFAESKISVLFEVESAKCLNLIALNQQETARAEAVLKDVICVCSICYTDEFKERKSSNDFHNLSKQWDGKFLFDGEEEEEGSLLATNDVIESIQDFFKVTKISEGNRSSGREPEENFSAETKLVITSVHDEDELQLQVQKLEKKYHCRISKEFVEPQLGNCWLLGTDKEMCKVPKFFRVHRISGHAEFLNVDALVWPCTTYMFPLNDFLRCYDQYGEYLKYVKYKASL